ncbi:hypothetical protein Mth01_39660 [Sphaerimonospora thailandensis]|uniref:Uncharacterized protein n=1 Tax=Sphaerimonospora thailandensis TaxID=795644 RepID=A0A8J3RG25_9ACTN|nr:hypothetical protein Mth01_39660 [Sphaerimonospora thailandensis]
MRPGIACTRTERASAGEEQARSRPFIETQLAPSAWHVEMAEHLLDFLSFGVVGAEEEA